MDESIVLVCDLFETATTSQREFDEGEEIRQERMDVLVDLIRVGQKTEGECTDRCVAPLHGMQVRDHSQEIWEDLLVQCRIRRRNRAR